MVLTSSFLQTSNPRTLFLARTTPSRYPPPHTAYGLTVKELENAYWGYNIKAHWDQDSEAGDNSEVGEVLNARLVLARQYRRQEK